MLVYSHCLIGCSEGAKNNPWLFEHIASTGGGLRA